MNAVGYARYSTDLQTENSIAYQTEKITEYCDSNDIILLNIYKDEAQSGTNINRSGFQKLLSDAKLKLFDAVIIYDITRGSRDVGDWFTFRKAMMLLDIKVISTTQPLGDLTNSNDFLVELISVGMGQREVLENRSKSLAGVKVKAKQGVFLGGTPPLGYDIVDGKYVINPIEAELVKKIFENYADGKSYNYIIDSLNGARGKKGKLLGKNSLSSILRNERYIGTYFWNKRQVKLLRQWAGGKPNPNCVTIPDAIPKIIDLYTWERVQKRLKDNKRNATNKAKEDYLLSGLIKCSCGATFIGHTSKKGEHIYKSYICGDKYRTRSCKAKNINGYMLEQFCIENLKSYISDIDKTNTARIISEQINGASIDLSAEKKELKEIETKIENGVKYVLSGKSFPELEAELDILRTRKGELEDIIKAKEVNEIKKIEPSKIEKFFDDSIELIKAGKYQELIKRHVMQIYADIDGNCTINFGVHLSGCGGRI